MKFLFLLSALCFGHYTYAQNLDSILLKDTLLLKHNVFTSLENRPITESKNMVKLGPSIVSIPAFFLQYEHGVFKKNSIGVSLGYIGRQKIPLYRLISRKLSNRTYVKNQLERIRYSGFSIAPEFRFYLGKEQFKGFYIGPFLRYAVYDAKLPLQYHTDQLNYIYQVIDFKGNIRSLTAGISFGAQFKLSNKLYLDWLVIGPHVGLSSEYLYANKKLSKTEQIAINESLNLIQEKLHQVENLVGFNLPYINYTYQVDDNGARIRFKEKWLGIKMFIGLGFRF